MDIRKVWTNEVRWWGGNLQARWLGETALSARAGGKQRMRICVSAAAVCIAGAVVLNAAWVAVAKRWATPSRTVQKSVEDNFATTALLVAYLRRIGLNPAAAVRSPPLLLCAAPGEKPPPQTVAEVPSLVPAVPLSSLATMSLFLSNLPLFVGVDDVTGGLVVEMKDDSIEASASFPISMDALDCGWRSVWWRREQQAVQKATSRTRITNRLRGQICFPTFSRDPPLLLLCAAVEQEAPSVRQIGILQGPTLMPGTSMSSPAEIGVFLSSIPLLVGVGSTTKEALTHEAPKPEIATPLLLTHHVSVVSLAIPTRPLLLLCDQERGPESHRPAAVTTAQQAMVDEDMEVVVAPIQRDSPSKAAGRISSYPSTSLTSGESSRAVPSRRPTIKTLASQPILWGLPVVNRAKPAAGRHVNAPPSTSALNASAGAAHVPKGGRGVSDDADGVSGGGGETRASGGGGGGGARSTNKKPRALWTLPGQAPTATGVGALGNAYGCPPSAKIAGKPVPIFCGEENTSGDCNDRRIRGASTGDSVRPSLSGSLLRSALGLSATSSRGGTADVLPSTWAVGKARRGSMSPEGAGKSSPYESGRGRGGRSVCVPTAGPSLEVAGASNLAGSRPPAAAPRSILVASKGATSARRATAISRGVRWLDIAEKEEQQAINRRKRASRWTGGCRKREGPPTAAPRASRALVFARESEVTAAF